MGNQLVIHIAPGWEPDRGQLYVSADSYTELRAALEAAGVKTLLLVRESADEVLNGIVVLGSAAASTAPFWQSLVPAFEAFLSRHADKRVEIRSGKETSTFEGYSASDVRKILKHADEIRDQRR